MIGVLDATAGAAETIDPVGSTAEAAAALDVGTGRTRGDGYLCPAVLAARILRVPGRRVAFDQRDVSRAQPVEPVDRMVDRVIERRHGARIAQAGSRQVEHPDRCRRMAGSLPAMDLDQAKARSVLERFY